MSNLVPVDLATASVLWKAACSGFGLCRYTPLRLWNKIAPRLLGQHDLHCTLPPLDAKQPAGGTSSVWRQRARWKSSLEAISALADISATPRAGCARCSLNGRPPDSSRVSPHSTDSELDRQSQLLFMHGLVPKKGAMQNFLPCWPWPCRMPRSRCWTRRTASVQGASAGS